MVAPQITRALVVWSLIVVAGAALASTVQAQERTRLIARFSGIKARAVYEERQRDNRYKFNFQLELAQPGATGVVSASAAGGAVPLGTFVVDGLGRGIIDIDTGEGDFVPDLNVGTVISLQYQGKVFTGTLRQR